MLTYVHMYVDARHS